MARMSKKEAARRLKKRIADRNYRFRKMTPIQQRIRVAQDVIDQLKAGQIEAENGVYLDVKGTGIAYEVQSLLSTLADLSYQISDVSDARVTWGRREYRALMKQQKTAQTELEVVGGQQVCTILEDAKCTVCGIGAVFVAAVKRADDLTVAEFVEGSENFGDDGKMREYLQQYFDKDDIGLIECAFERSDSFARYAHNLSTSDRAVGRAVRFGDRYFEDDTRLVAIMENIIENKGRFVP